MLHPISRIAALALVAPLAGTMLLAAPASAASAKAPTGVVTKADDPFSSFTINLSAPKRVKAGGKITYIIKATNKGPYLADSFWTGGVLPKGSKLTKVYAPKGSECGLYDDGFWCLTPRALQIGDSESISVVVQLSKKTRGTATAYLGVDTVDLPTGAETLNRDELERLGIKHWYFVKKAKTGIVR
ncbi:hypothetical protein [Streptosporangium sp. NPDC051022]|uniref:hypothetical protein n=1 Tax=Streptosporangium sp. NPDC051022 TaxID=3155752 RepID=UPI003420C3F1